MWGFPTREASACHRHTSPAERAEIKAAQDAFEAYVDERRRRPPACHTWPLPTERPTDDPETSAFGILGEWQDDRCAACGGRGSLVIDHDHNTGFVRGLLCSSCNGFEPGARPGETLGLYRERPPVALLGLTPWRYWSPWTGEAQPPDPHAPDET